MCIRDRSSNTNNPLFPKVSLSAINSSTGKTGDLLIGEKFVGTDSKAKGIYVQKYDDSTACYLSLNDYTFQLNETVTFEESGITATVSSTSLGANNITDRFEYDDGQRDTIYDYARITRKSGFNSPSKRLTIVFESAYFTASDTGDITTVNSYDNFTYKDLPIINDANVSDLSLIHI